MACCLPSGCAPSSPSSPVSISPLKTHVLSSRKHCPAFALLLWGGRHLREETPAEVCSRRLLSEGPSATFLGQSPTGWGALWATWSDLWRRPCKASWGLCLSGTRMGQVDTQWQEMLMEEEKWVSAGSCRVAVRRLGGVQQRGVPTMQEGVQAGCLTWWGVTRGVLIAISRTLQVRLSHRQHEAHCPGPSAGCPLFLPPPNTAVTRGDTAWQARSLPPKRALPMRGARAGSPRVSVPGAGPQLGGSHREGLLGSGVGALERSRARETGRRGAVKVWARRGGAGGAVPACWRRVSRVCTAGVPLRAQSCTGCPALLGCFPGQSPCLGPQ